MTICILNLFQNHEDAGFDEDQDWYLTEKVVIFKYLVFEDLSKLSSIRKENLLEGNMCGLWNCLESEFDSEYAY
jgi:hypothetical protein